MPKKARLRVRVSNTSATELKKALAVIHDKYGVEEMSVTRTDALYSNERVRNKTIHVGDITGNNLILISVLPILGHGFSPFLKFKGGKALAVTAGMWLALFGIEAFLALFVSLAIIWTIQKNDAWTVNLSHLGLFLYGMTVDISNQYFTLNNFLITWIIAALFMLFKHRIELRELPKFRNIKRDFRRLV